MMSKLQHVINYMDMYHMKRNIPCLERRGDRGLKKAFVILFGIPNRNLR